MPDENAGTTPEGGEAQEPEAKPATGTPAGDEVTTLRSRNAGLDAKVTELSKSAKDAIARAEAAEARALELANGKDNGDAELRAQLTAKEAELAAARIEAKVNKLEAKYPETYAVFGDAVAGMSDDILAASEARLKGVPAESHEPPTPVGNNPQRPSGAAPEKLTYAQRLAAFKATPFPEAE